MLHAAGNLTAKDARDVLFAYLSEWRELARSYGDAVLIDEEFVGSTDAKGILVPRPDSYFDQFYAARDAYAPYIQALCKLRVDGQCVYASGKLREAGAWPEPEAEGRTLSDDILALAAYLELGTADKPPYAALPQRKSRAPAVAAAAIGLGILGLGLGIFAARAKRRR